MPVVLFVVAEIVWVGLGWLIARLWQVRNGDDLFAFGYRRLAWFVLGDESCDRVLQLPPELPLLDRKRNLGLLGGLGITRWYMLIVAEGWCAVCDPSLEELGCDGLACAQVAEDLDHMLAPESRAKRRGNEYPLPDFVCVFGEE